MKEELTRFNESVQGNCPICLEGFAIRLGKDGNPVKSFGDESQSFLDR